MFELERIFEVIRNFVQEYQIIKSACMSGNKFLIEPGLFDRFRISLDELQQIRDRKLKIELIKTIRHLQQIILYDEPRKTGRAFTCSEEFDEFTYLCKLIYTTVRDYVVGMDGNAEKFASLDTALNIRGQSLLHKQGYRRRGTFSRRPKSTTPAPNNEFDAYEPFMIPNRIDACDKHDDSKCTESNLREILKDKIEIKDNIKEFNHDGTQGTFKVFLCDNDVVSNQMCTEEFLPNLRKPENFQLKVITDILKHVNFYKEKKEKKRNMAQKFSSVVKTANDLGRSSEHLFRKRLAEREERLQKSFEEKQRERIRRENAE